MDSRINWVVRDCWTCESCDKNKAMHTPPLSPMEVPSEPWVKLGLDIAGPFELLPATERYVLLLVDFASK